MLDKLYNGILNSHNKALDSYTNAENLLVFCPLSWHEEEEIVVVNDGKIEVRADGESFEATKGDIVVLSPYVIHSVTPLDNASISGITLNLRLSATTQNLKSYTQIALTNKFLPYVLSENSNLCKCVKPEVDKLLCTDEPNTNTLEKLLSLLHSQKHSSTNNNEKQVYTLKCILQYIRENYNKVFPISDLTLFCGYSEFYVMKLFKQLTGYTIVDYINNYRLFVATDKLLCTNEPVSAIAQSVGYNNISYFNRCFKAMYGTTPKAYRVLHNGT